MPKMKSKSGAKKRFKLSGSGKIRYYAAGKRHILTKKKPRRRRHLRGVRTLTGGDAKQIHRVLPYG